MEDVLYFVETVRLDAIKDRNCDAQNSLCNEVALEKFAFQHDEREKREKHKKEGDIIEGRTNEGQNDRGEVKQPSHSRCCEAEKALAVEGKG